MSNTFPLTLTSGFKGLLPISAEEMYSRYRPSGDTSAALKRGLSGLGIGISERVVRVYSAVVSVSYLSPSGDPGEWADPIREKLIPRDGLKTDIFF